VERVISGSTKYFTAEDKRQITWAGWQKTTEANTWHAIHRINFNMSCSQWHTMIDLMFVGRASQVKWNIIADKNYHHCCYYYRLQLYRTISRTGATKSGMKPLLHQPAFWCLYVLDKNPELVTQFGGKQEPDVVSEHNIIGLSSFQQYLSMKLGKRFFVADTTILKTLRITSFTQRKRHLLLVDRVASGRSGGA